jgi:hypothetical protein
MKLLQKNCTTANTPPHTSTAGHTPTNPRQPLIVITSHAGMMSDTKGSCRPAIALSVLAGMPVTAASGRIGVPMAPNATGAVLMAPGRGIERREAGADGSAEQIATGVRSPQRPR